MAAHLHFAISMTIRLLCSNCRTRAQPSCHSPATMSASLLTRLQVRALNRARPPLGPVCTIWTFSTASSGLRDSPPSLTAPAGAAREGLRTFFVSTPLLQDSTAVCDRAGDSASLQLRNGTEDHACTAHLLLSVTTCSSLTEMAVRLMAGADELQDAATQRCCWPGTEACCPACQSTADHVF